MYHIVRKNNKKEQKNNKISKSSYFMWNNFSKLLNLLSRA